MRDFSFILRINIRYQRRFFLFGYVAGNEALYTFLQKAGYIVVLKPTLEYTEKGLRKTKGNVDTELVMHAMVEFPNYDKAIIVSGDGDFHCLVEHLEKQRKLLHLLIPNPRKYSALLRKFRKYFIYINNSEKKLGKKRRGSNLRTGP